MIVQITEWSSLWSYCFFCVLFPILHTQLVFSGFFCSNAFNTVLHTHNTGEIDAHLFQSFLICISKISFSCPITVLYPTHQMNPCICMQNYLHTNHFCPLFLVGLFTHECCFRFKIYWFTFCIIEKKINGEYNLIFFFFTSHYFHWREIISL